MIDSTKYYSDKKFLKATQVKEGTEFTIESFEEITMSGRVKPVLHFKGVDETFSLNRTNLLKLIQKFGKDEAKWPGKKIKLIFDVANNPQTGQPTDRAMRIA